ncbi:hypothetical protein C8J57DRAFT_1497643 [Mycena rebaudengoi]|nr:hypothetical protein C8J57DRAFT_1497643 [Mycena rebaudengoi]
MAMPICSFWLSLHVYTSMGASLSRLQQSEEKSLFCHVEEEEEPLIKCSTHVAKTKAITNAVWTGTTPQGKKLKDSESEMAPEPSRKRADLKLSSIQAEEDEDSLRANAQEDAPMLLGSNKTILFGNYDAESDKEELPGYQVYEEVVDDNNDDNLAALGDEDSRALSAVLAEETDQDNDDKLPSPFDPRFMQIHSSGRSSTSSGHFSVPGSSNADTDSDDDPETKAMFSSLQHAQETVPVPHKKSAKPAVSASVPVPSKKTATRVASPHEPLKASAPVKSTTQASKTSHPSAPSRSKWEVASADMEQVDTVTMQPKARQSAPQVKLEEVAHPVPSPRPVKIKKEVTRDTTIIAAHDIIKIDDDDEEPQAYDADIRIIVMVRQLK